MKIDDHNIVEKLLPLIILTIYISKLKHLISNIPIPPSHLLSLPPKKLLRKHTHTTHSSQKPYIFQQQQQQKILASYILIFMHANLKPFSLMGLPNKIASPEKDLHVTTKGEVVYSNCLQDTEETLSEKSSVSTPPLKIRVPSRGVDDDGGCTTPKAEDRGEVVLLKCPPPPRKPKSVPLQKRKARRVLLDLSNEIDSMFPSHILTDFMCGKIKKIRTGCSQIV